MAFTGLSASLIEVGKAVKKEIFTVLKNDTEDLNTRLSSVESAASKIIVADGVLYNATPASTFTGFYHWLAPFDFTLIDAKVAIFEKGSSTGTLEMNVLKSASLDRTAGSSVFTTRPSINVSTASNYDESTNAVFDVSTKDISAGDYLIFDITSLPSPTLGRFQIYLIGEI